MILVAIVVLVGLTIMNLRLANSPFYPPAIFTGLWAGLLVLLLLCGDLFYPLLYGSLMVFMVGAACFSLGGFFGRAVPQHAHPPLSPRHREFLWRVIDVAIVAMIAFFPFYVQRLGEIINSSSILYDPFVALRHDLCNLEGDKLGLGMFNYAVSLFDLLTLVAWSECDNSPGRRKRCWIMAALVLAYHVSTLARIGAMLFVFSLCWLVFFRRRKIALPQVIAGTITFILVFSTAAIILGKGGYRDAGLLENVTSVFHSFVHYLLGGLVAFNEVLCNPSIVDQNLFAFFHKIANAFGADYEVYRVETIYVRTPEWTNVFTMYMSPYSQFGLFGVALYMSLLGGFCAWIHGAAERGSSWARVFYARIAGSLLFTGAAGPFLPSLSLWIQLGVWCWVLYWLPRLFLGRPARPRFSSCRASTFQKGVPACSRIGY